VIIGIVLICLILVSALVSVQIERMTRREKSSRNDDRFMWGCFFTILGLGACVTDLVFAILFDVVDDAGVTGWIFFVALFSIGIFNIWKSDAK